MITRAGRVGFVRIVRLVRIVGIVGFVGCATPPAPAPEPVRFSAAIPEGLILGAFTLSRDGNWLAYSAEAAGDGRRTIFVRDLREPAGEGRELAGSAGGTNPFFSPDGAHVGYFAQGAVWRIAAQGNAQPLRIADMPAEAAGATWTDDDRIVIAPLGSRGLMAMPAGGGSTIAMTQLAKDELAHGWPHAVPGGAIAFTVSQRNRDPHLEVVSPDGSRARLRAPIVGQSAYVETGHLVYSYLGNLMAVRFDPDDPTNTGVPQLVASGVQVSAGHGTLGRAGFAVSASGTLTWLRASAEDAKSRIVRVAPTGRYRTLPPVPAIYQTPRISPDGRHLAVTVRPDVMTREIHVIDISGSRRPPFTIRGGDNQSPAWMDNRRLSFGSNRDGVQKIYVTPLGGTPAPLLASDASVARNPASWTRPPRLLTLYEIDPMRGRDVLVYRAGGSVEPVVATAANERSPAVSPDGRWLAYVSDASGRDEIYVKPLDLSMDALQMTNSGASEPVWARDGLCYRQGDRMMRVSLDAGAPGALQQVFEGYFERDPGSNLPAYDIDRDGTFIMLKSALMPRELRVVRHWGTELARAVQ
jgi:eukaryotic-like serine/threonine-protein kinase